MFVFAAGWDWLIPAVFVTLWAINMVRRFVVEPQPPQRPQPRHPQVDQAKPRPEPEKELERFLEELGVRRGQSEPRTKEPPPQPSSAKPRQQAAGQRRQPRQASSPEHRKPRREPPLREEVRQRHLTSEIDSRHREAMHSSLEDQSIQPSIGADQGPSLLGSTLAPMRSSTRAMASMAPLKTLLHDKGQLTAAMIVGQVLDRPLGMRR